MGSKTTNTILTITRPGVALHYNSSGVLVTAEANQLRFDYNPTTLEPRGALIEPGITNLLVHSTQFDTTWTTFAGSTVSANVAIDPRGYLLADKLIEGNTAPAGSPYYVVTQTQSVTGNTFTFSVYMKAGERYMGGLRLDDGTSSNVINFGINLQTGVADFEEYYGNVIAPMVKVEPINNGWWRCGISTKFTASTPSTARVMIRLRRNDGTYNYTGDGVSGLYIWGAQLEGKGYMSSLALTATSQTSRQGDVVEVNNISWLNPREGTFIIEAQRYAPANANTAAGSGLLVGLSQTGAIANSIYVENNAVGESWVGGVVWANNVVQAFPSANTGNITVPFKHAFAYKANDVAVCVNGGSIAHDALADIPQNIEIARIGCAPWTPTANRWDGWIRNVKYYPTRLANSVMQSLTT